eukprot:7746219-Alexandrium_andersonii.AAC.1
MEGEQIGRERWQGDRRTNSRAIQDTKRGAGKQRLREREANKQLNKRAIMRTSRQAHVQAEEQIDRMTDTPTSPDADAHTHTLTDRH